MPTEFLEDELYRKYDMVVSEILTRLFYSVDDRNTIRLLGFKRNNKEHLLVLRIAIMLRDIYQTQIEIDGSWWDRFLINRKIKKPFGKVGAASNYSIDGIWVPDLLDTVHSFTNYTFDFGNIYDAYYEGSCN